MTEKLAKGYATEELLRRYFIQSGYYTVRSVPFLYRGFDVTDIDLWLYDRPSSVTRHRIIVDCKNKATPKVIERIFWTKGLQQVLRVEQAVVATTDTREAVGEFGREHGVLILDGQFIAKLQQATDGFAGRLTEEDFEALIATYQPSKSKGDWRARYKLLKAPFAQNLGYNAINYWAEEAKYFCEQSLIVKTHQQLALRLVYLILSYVCIGFDFALRDVSFSSSPERVKVITEGLKHGAPGPRDFKSIVDIAASLIDRYVPENRAVAFRLRDRVEHDLAAIPAQALAQHLGKQSVSQELFATAKEFDACAYRTTFVSPSAISAAARGVLSAFLDYWSVSRSDFFDLHGTEDTAEPATPTAVQDASSNSAQPELPGIGLPND